MNFPVAVKRDLFQPTMLSIDWDFFLWRGLEAAAPNIVVHPGTDKASEVSAGWFFDWGHSENRAPVLQNVLWGLRYGTFTRAGLDPRVVAGFRDVTPAQFADKLAEIFPSMESAPVLAGDSHGWGFRCVRDTADIADGQPIRVVHFDAHADLGYLSTEDMRRESERQQFDCASWLYHAINEGLVDEMVFVWPDWRNEKEAEQVRKAEHLLPLLPKITMMPWSEWAKTPTAGSDVLLTNVARSGAWAPPWFDDDFHQFVFHQLASNEVTCLDCDHGDGDPVDSGEPHACTPREFAPIDVPDVPGVPT